METLCPVCESLYTEYLFTRFSWDLYRCEVCSHVFVSPCPSEVQLSRLYSKRYFAGGIYPDYVRDHHHCPVTQQAYETRLGIIERSQPPGDLLDVGCATGAFLVAAQKRGWGTTGIEISPYAVQVATQEFGLRVLCGDLLQVSFEPESCDVITLWATIEHLSMPAAYLARLWKILRPGGMLAVNTGNWSSPNRRIYQQDWRHIVPPYHLQFFTPQSMRHLLTSKGFVVSRLECSEGEFLTLKPYPLAVIFDRFGLDGIINAVAGRFNLLDEMLVLVRKL